MGSSENMAGSIVWVRRRNGSWWPGKILGPNELSASHLMSPRSGTPVKLLGREDASVDWYNLEKSKRVKAFRCGEFDDCIERAEASIGLPAKKREKYARREDAILHALELEKQYLMKKHGKLALTNFMRENSSDSGRRISATSSLALENGNGEYRNHELYQLDEKIDASSMTERNSTPLLEYKPQDRTYPNLQGHNTEESHQMKGLQDSGLRAIPVNRMIHTCAAFDDSNRMAIDRTLCSVPTNDPSFESFSDSDPWKSISKGKRSLKAVEGFIEVSLLQRQADYSLQHDLDFISMYKKREDAEGGCHSGYLPVDSPMVFDSHCVPQEQVEMPTSRFDVANSHHGTFAEETTSGSSEETESDSSETHSLEPHVEAGMVLSDAETHVKAQARTPDSSGMRRGDENTRNDESHDDSSQFHLPEPNSPGFGVSKWLLKRKRNARNFPKRPMNIFSCRAYLQERGMSLNHEDDYSEDDVDFIAGDFEPSTQEVVKTRFLPSLAAAKGPNLGRQNIIDSGELAWGRPSRGYCEKRGKCFNAAFVDRSGHDLLIDVDLKVQANHQGENVPWVSLMSRLDGKAIIGHPIQIEALEDGSTDILVPPSDLKYDIDRETTLPSWRTGNFWHLSSHLEGDENAENQFYHQSGKVRSKNLAPPNSFQSSSVKKTHIDHIPSQPPRYPFQGMKKKTNLSSNLKTETVSSFGFNHKSKKRRREKNPNYILDSTPPAVACIPVKLVFSRLLEAIGRAPSGPAKRGVSQ